LQPLLALSQLAKLQLEFTGSPAVAAQDLQQLSTLSSLQELGLSYRLGAQADVEGAAKAWPVKSLLWVYEEVPPHLLEQLRELQGLTQLVLSAVGLGGGSIHATPEQLAVVLQQLVNLQCLTIDGYGRMSCKLLVR
jgi:hypothetical protein